jgi:hypothetical protein
MPASPRVRSQLALQVPPDLLDRLRNRAATEGRTLSAMCLAWIEKGLAAEAAAGAVDLDGLEARIEVLEIALAALSPSPQAAPIPAAPARPLVPPAAAPAPAPVLTGEGPAPITTAELAERTETNRASWNNWAAKAAVGDVRSHAKAGPWRLVGKAPAPGGGPLRFIWEPA